ncbi:MAG: DUF86 domain-containing protein [Thiobacillus sp.]
MAIYISDKITFSEKVMAYTHEMEQGRFEQSGLNYDATLRNIELIGEAATHIPEHARQFASQIDWRRIVATRNRLIHGYIGIDNDTLWSIIQTDIPALLHNLHALKAAADAGQIADPAA